MIEAINIVDINKTFNISKTEKRGFVWQWNFHVVVVFILAQIVVFVISVEHKAK